MLRFIYKKASLLAGLEKHPKFMTPKLPSIGKNPPKRLFSLDIAHAYPKAVSKPPVKPFRDFLGVSAASREDSEAYWPYESGILSGNSFPYRRPSVYAHVNMSVRYMTITIFTNLPMPSAIKCARTR